MKQKPWLKIVIPVVSLVLVAAIVLGVLYASNRSGGEPVNVYAFPDVGMTEYWADSQESYGPISTDDIQTVYLSDTQSVTQILVEVGDTVKKGDLLMVFDTTLSDLALERERLAVEKLKLQLQDAQKELTEIKNMKPMIIPSVTEPEETEPDLGTQLTTAYAISTRSEYDGSTQDKALICWVQEGTELDDILFEAVRQAAIAFQTQNLPQELPTEPSEEPTEPSEEPTEPSEEPAEPSEEPTEPSEEPTEPSEEPTEPSEEPTDPSVEPTEPSEEPTEPSEEPTEPSEEPTEPSEEPTEPSEEPTEPQPTVDVTHFYVVFKVTQGDMSLGSVTVWQGLHLRQNPTTGTFTFSLYDASGMVDHTLDTSDSTPGSTPDIDFGSGYTSTQIAEMRRQQEKTIKDLEFQIKMAEANYKIKQTEVADGCVYAEFDGEVVSLLSEEEARLDNQPLLKVSGGGGYYIEGSVSELEKDSLQIGQEVTVNDWYNGTTYVGTIQSIGDAPSSNSGWTGLGNPNTSYYPFVVYVDGSADLRSGYYASITFTSATAEHGIYLENPFLRTEQGRSYVYVEDANGVLEKRYVTTGKSLWGSYTEILSGLTAEDYIAFPYGKTVKVGAQTKQSEISELYNY